MITFLTGLTLGLILGRLYGHMKYRYPEFQEVIQLRVAKLRAERAEYEYRTEASRLKTDDLLNQRLR